LKFELSVATSDFDNYVEGARRDEAERIAAWLESKGNVYSPEDIYREEVYLLAGEVRSGAYRPSGGESK
jgi:hypothetical protein